MLGVLFGVLGGAWVAFMELLGAYENVKKPLVSVVFSAFGSSRGLLRSLFFVFFDFRSFFQFFRLYLHSFFGFRSFFRFLRARFGSTSVFTGAIRPLRPSLVGSWEVLGWSWGVLGDSLGDPVGDQARQTLRLCMFARFLSGGPQGFLVGPWDVLGGAWGLLGGTLGVLGRP